MGKEIVGKGRVGQLARFLGRELKAGFFDFQGERRNRLEPCIEN